MTGLHCGLVFSSGLIKYFKRDFIRGRRWSVIGDVFGGQNKGTVFVVKLIFCIREMTKPEMAIEAIKLCKSYYNNPLIW